MKFSDVAVFVHILGSLPVRGAWIEIQIVSEVGKNDVVSLPVRGAWIEIVLVSRLMSGTWSSLPVRGAWIEIFRFCVMAS